MLVRTQVWLKGGVLAGVQDREIYLQPSEGRYPIPNVLNICIAAAQLVSLITMFWVASWVSSWHGLAVTAILYGIIMNSAYSTIHEAEHNLFHRNSRLNVGAGVILALFFPAPFHLIRQGHIGHHLRNRSDDEAFDVYFPEDQPVWRWLYWYGIITGVFWIVVATSNFLVLFVPTMTKQNGWFARPTEAVLESFNPKYWPVIRLEAAAAILLHLGLVVALRVPLLHYCVMVFGFGFMWSAMQYVHHFATERDVRHGARNLRTFPLLDLIWLNHNYHLNHHMRPTVPWIYLPSLYQGEQFDRSSLLLAYLRMWRGPRLTQERVNNIFAGRIIK